MKSQVEQDLKAKCVWGGKYAMLAENVVTKKIAALQFYCCSFSYRQGWR